MAFAWADTFVAPNAIAGFSSGAATDIDEWPFSSSDTVIRSHTASQSHTNLTFGFDMSVGPGDKKGFWFWFKSHVSNATGIRFDAIRLVDAGGPTTLWTNSSPGITVIETTSGSALIYVINIPDSAFSGNPDIDDLEIQIDTTNLHGGNNNWTIHGARLTKSPFTAAQEETNPAGVDFVGWSASSIIDSLGGANDEELVVLPDVSGRGVHAVRIAGSGAVLKTADGGYVDLPVGDPTRFIATLGLGGRLSGDALRVSRAYALDATDTQAIHSAAGEFKGVVSPPTVPNDKVVLAFDIDEFTAEAGDGSGGAHLTGGTSADNTWYWLGLVVRDSGNELLFVDDNTTPVIDGASGNSDMYVWSLFNRETDDRPLEGRWSASYFMDADTLSDSEITDAMDEWVNGSGSSTTLTGIGDGSFTAVVDEIDTTVDLVLSVDDLPSSPNDSDWVNNQAIAASVFFETSATPGDFVAALSAGIVVRYRGQNWSGGTRNLYARLYESDETTPMSDEVLVATVTANTSFANTSEIAFTGLNLSATKTDWDSARIRFRWA